MRIVRRCLNRETPDGHGLRAFAYESDGDTHGLLYHLGTLGSSGDVEGQHSNPFTTDMVSLWSSELASVSEPLSFFVGRSPASCCTKWRKASYMAIDLQRASIKLTRYSMSCTSNSKYLMRKWNLEGSSNGTDWFILREHRDDQSFTESGQIRSWPIETRQFFSKFRIVTAGGVFACCLELYGDAINYVPVFKQDTCFDVAHYSSADLTEVKYSSQLLGLVRSHVQQFVVKKNSFFARTFSAEDLAPRVWASFEIRNLVTKYSQ